MKKTNSGFLIRRADVCPKCVSAFALALALAASPSADAATFWQDPAAVLNSEANTLIKSEKPGEALNKYKAAQAESPESPILHYNIGLALDKQGKREEAIKSFNNVVTKDPMLQAQTRYNVASIRFRQAEEAQKAQNAQEAMTQYKASMDANWEAMKLAPDYEPPKINYELARLRLEKLRQQQEQKQQEQQSQQDKDKQDEDKDKDKDKESQQQQPDKNKTDQQEQNQKDKDPGQNQGQSGQDSPKQDDPPKQDPEQQKSDEQKKKEQEEQQKKQQQQQEKKKDDPSQGGQGSQPQPSQADPARLTPEQAERMLNQLGEEDINAIRQLFRPRGMPLKKWEKDW